MSRRLHLTWLLSVGAPRLDARVNWGGESTKSFPLNENYFVVHHEVDRYVVMGIRAVGVPALQYNTTSYLS